MLSGPNGASPPEKRPRTITSGARYTEDGELEITEITEITEISEIRRPPGVTEPKDDPPEFPENGGPSHGDIETTNQKKRSR